MHKYTHTHTHTHTNTHLLTTDQQNLCGPMPIKTPNTSLPSDSSELSLGFSDELLVSAMIHYLKEITKRRFNKYSSLPGKDLEALCLSNPLSLRVLFNCSAY